MYDHHQPTARSGDLNRAVSDLATAVTHQGNAIRKQWVAITGLGIALGCVIASILLSPTAHADDRSFTNDISDAGFQGAATSEYLTLGRKICYALIDGDSKHDIAETIYEHTKFESVGDAMQLVNIANRDLCPGASL